MNKLYTSIVQIMFHGMFSGILLILIFAAVLAVATIPLFIIIFLNVKLLKDLPSYFKLFFLKYKLFQIIIQFCSDWL